MQKSRALRIALLAGALALSAIPAHAQSGGRVLSNEITGIQAESALRKAVPAERLLPALPIEAMDLRAKESPGTPVIVPGNPGPKAAAKAVHLPEPSGGGGGGISPENYGVGSLSTAYHYSDRRVDPALVPLYPQRTVGYFLHTFNGTNFFFCTATLISRSIIVTAAHCVYNTNTNQYITAGTFFPACTNCNGGSPLMTPYGSATAYAVIATAGWKNALTESAALDKGYDVALVALRKRTSTTVEIGTATGWMGWCFQNCLQPFWQLTQLGYPANYDGGNRMQHGEHIEISDTRDYLMGSGMRGGSSGGPHVNGLGTLVDSATDKGQFAGLRNTIFAVTSWGFISEANKRQGASSLSGPGNTNGLKVMWNFVCANARALHGTATCALIP